MLFAVAVAAACWIARLLTWGGAIAAALVGGVIWEVGGWPWVAPLLTFFLSSSALGLLGRSRKAEMGVEARPRRAVQVLANGAPAAVCAGIYNFDPHPALAAAALASFAAANADTWATEVGALVGKRPFRILTLAPAPSGESGVVTLAGLFAAFVGAAAVGSTAPLLGLTKFIGAFSVIGFLACLLDSVLGDGLQAKYLRDDGSFTESPPGVRVGGWPWMTNEAVNFISVALAAVAGYWIAR